MAIDGERSLRKMLSIGSGTSVIAAPTIPANPLPGCCTDYVFPVLADNTGKSVQNDINTVIWWFNPTASAATLVLKKWNGSTWANAATISDNTYGTYGAFGYYTNSESQKFISLEIAWSKVLSGLGAGSYKITCTYTDSILGSGTVDSYEFCLNTYSAILAEGTVRLEYWLSGISEDITNDILIKDFGTLNIYNSMRVKGYFGYPKSPYKNEDVEYSNGQSVWVEERREPVYECTLWMIPEFKHAILRTDFMMADQLAITDYNSKNNASYATKYIRPDSEYSPDYEQLQADMCPVDLKFRPQNNRSRKFRN